MAGTEQKISPLQRANLFNQTTRRNWQNLGSLTGAESGTLRFDIPKSRLLSGVKIQVEATLTATHSSNSTYTAHEDSPFKFLQRAELSLNNGFSPFSVTGQGLAAYNMTLHGTEEMTSSTTGRGKVVQGLTASSGGTANTVKFVLDMPTTVNPRDPIGLILLQNEETQATVNITLGTKADLAPASSGYTFAVSDIKVTLLTDTYAIPAIPEAFPDLSVLKLVNERTEAMIAGENIYKLPVGQTYRKLIFIVYNGTPARQADSIITSNIELMFNQAEIPYRLTSVQLAEINTTEYDGALPTGMYVFDFSDNGVKNLGGARDYIDTERLTEFWLKFTASTTGTVKIIYETLSRLR